MHGVFVLLGAVILSMSPAVDLRSFVCDETIQRFHNSKPLDVITAKVSFEDGVEHYREIRQNGQPRSSIPEIGGAWSTGEWNWNLPWKLRIDHSRDCLVQYWSRTVFSGTEITVERIGYKMPAHTGISALDWTVTYDLRDVNGDLVTVPKSANYIVLYRDGDDDRNEITFSNYRRYGAESVLRVTP